MSTDIRWQQRFSNFQKALLQLDKAVKMEEYTDLEREGMIQRFVYTFELAWKTLQDVLQSEGYEIAGPKSVIKQAFQDGYVPDGDAWIEMLDSQVLAKHTYDEERAMEIADKIKKRFYPLLDLLDKKLSSLI